MPAALFSILCDHNHSVLKLDRFSESRPNTNPLHNTGHSQFTRPLKIIVGIVAEGKRKSAYKPGKSALVYSAKLKNLKIFQDSKKNC